MLIQTGQKGQYGIERIEYLNSTLIDEIFINKNIQLSAPVTRVKNRITISNVRIYVDSITGAKDLMREIIYFFKSKTPIPLG